MLSPLSSSWSSQVHYYIAWPWPTFDWWMFLLLSYRPLDHEAWYCLVCPLCVCSPDQLDHFCCFLIGPKDVWPTMIFQILGYPNGPEMLYFDSPLITVLFDQLWSPSTLGTEGSKGVKDESILGRISLYLVWNLSLYQYTGCCMSA